MEALPMITIVTVTYNAAQWLERCVDSVVMQQCKDFDIEHLIVDGSSTDGTVELLERLLDEGKISRFISEKDAGIYDAMNKGLALARGGIISYLNADDYYLDDHVVVDLVGPILKEGVAFTFANALFTDEMGNKVGVHRANFQFAFSETPFNHQTLFHQVDLLKEAGGFDMSFRSVADADFKAKLLLTKKAYKYIDRECVSFQLGGMSSHFYYDEVALLYLKYKKENLEYCQQQEYVPLQIERLKSYLRTCSYSMHVNKKDREKAQLTSERLAVYCHYIADNLTSEFSFYFDRLSKAFQTLSKVDQNQDQSYWKKWGKEVSSICPESIFITEKCLEIWGSKSSVLGLSDTKLYYKLLRRIVRNADTYWKGDLPRLAGCLMQWCPPLLVKLCLEPLKDCRVFSCRQKYTIKILTYYYQWTRK